MSTYILVFVLVVGILPILAIVGASTWHSWSQTHHTAATTPQPTLQVNAFWIVRGLVAAFLVALVAPALVLMPFVWR